MRDHDISISTNEHADSSTVLVASGHQLASVRAILSVERRVTEYDVLLTTCMERFRQGPATAVELAAHCRSTWPGAHISEVQIDSAIEAARAAGYIARQESLDSNQKTWMLTGLGVADLQTSADWASDALLRTRDELRRRAQRTFREISMPEAELWLDHIWAGLCAGIQAAYGIYEGEITALIDHQSLIPRSFDVDRILKEIREKSGVSDSVADFLSGLALAALDPSDPFGSELVTHISTGYLLHSFLGRRDLRAERDGAGSLQSMRVVIDTPWLHSALGSSRDRIIFESAIRASLSSGIEVVVFEHSLEELDDVVTRVEEEDLPVIDDEIGRGLDLDLLAAIYDGQAVSVFLMALRDREVRDWTEYRLRAAGLESDLKSLGVTVRRHFNDGSELRVDKCRIALQRAIEEAGTGRGDLPIRRDAETMTAAWRWRENNHYVGGGYWPGAFVVTTDRSMGPSYSQLNQSDDATLTVTPSQWMGIVSGCAKPAKVADLASAATDLLAREAVLAVAVKWPPELALQIARSLDPEAGVTRADVRFAQLTLEEILADQPEIIEDPEASGQRFAAALVAQRSRRVELVQRDRAERLKRAGAEQKDQVRSLTSSVTAERESRKKAELEASALQSELDTVALQLEDERVLGRRRTIRAALLVGGAGLSLIFSLMQMWFVVGASVAATGIVWGQSSDWVKRVEADWRGMLVAPIAEVVGVALQVISAIPD